MSSIAIIGADGSGKTTVTQRLVRSKLRRYKYVYMGLNVSAGSHTFPTMRWAVRFKSKMDRPSAATSEDFIGSAVRHVVRRLRQGRLWAAARLVNHLADEWYRQLASWYFQMRGFVVIYDRHFVFDLWDDARVRRKAVSSRFHGWFLQHCYPRPDLVILLDAPSEVLFARKREWSIEALERKRVAFSRLAEKMPKVSTVDATQQAEIVFAEVTSMIDNFLRPTLAVHVSHESGDPPSVREPEIAPRNLELPPTLD